ncbi:MAG: hypothetical protein U1F66_02105 [bacterium]
MTPPRGIRNFLLGHTRPQPDLELNPGSTLRLRDAANAFSNQGISAELNRDQGADAFLLDPTVRYRPALAETYRDQSADQLELFIHRSLALARGGERVSYYDTLSAHFALLQRSPAERIAAVTRQFVSAVEEYSNFLRYSPELSTEERMRYLFAAARILHTYWGYLQRPPSGVTLPPEAAELRRLLAATLNEVDRQLQDYYPRLQAEGFPDLARLEGVMEIIALRRALFAEDRDAQRSHAIALADYLRSHPPVATDSSWEARAERGLLEDPQILEQLARFDVPALYEYRSQTLNAYSLELAVLAAASLDRANEEEEGTVRTRYQRLSAVLTAAILRHPEFTLEEQLNRLQNPGEQATLVAELQEAQLQSAELARMLESVRNGQGLAELVVAAREAGQHLQALRGGLGANLLPGILDGNRRHHPLHRLAAALRDLPQLAQELNLPAHRPERELLRRGRSGIQQVEAFQTRHPELSLQNLFAWLDADGRSPHPAEGLTRDLIEAWQGQLSGTRDHEAFALFSLLHAAAEDRELAPGIRLSGDLRNQASTTAARIEGFEFRARRVLGHLTAPQSLASLGIGILATEFLPSLLIARAGATGSLAFRGFSLVSRGTLTPWGSALTGMGTGLGLSLAGATFSNLERSRLGLRTHWVRDFLGSGAINLATFGLTIPFSSWLRGRLMPEALQGGEVAALSLNRSMLLHGGTVAFGGATAWGLGYLGRGVTTGQWQVSGEEIAENLGSLLLWEGGAAGLRSIRSRVNLTERLGAYRSAQLEGLVDSLVARNVRLAPQRAALSRWLGREEYRHPGTLNRFAAAQAADYLPVQEGAGSTFRLRMTPPNRLPPPAPEPAPAPTPPAPQERVHFVVWERDPVPRLPASTASEAPVTPARTDPPAPHPEPVPLEASPYYFEVLQAANGEEPGGTFEFADLGVVEGDTTVRILGRSQFRFLSAAQRLTLSRNHLELTLQPDGTVAARNLSRLSEAIWGRGRDPDRPREERSWVLRPEGWEPIPSDRTVTLHPNDTIAIGNAANDGLADMSGAAVQFRLRPNLVPPLSLVRLGPGRRLRLGNMQLVRSGEGSVFRLLGSGPNSIEVIRSLGDSPGTSRRFIATDNPVIGEIGEEVRVTVGEGSERRTYRLLLDSPDRPAQWIPQIELNYSGNEESVRFRSTRNSLLFGRNHQPDFFTASYISRNHFQISIASDQGHPRYVLQVLSPNGLYFGGRLHPQGSQIGLFSGFYQMVFPMDRSGAALDAPFNIHLPPIEGAFEEWRLGPLLPHHDRGVPAAPPPPPPPPPVQGPPTTPPPAGPAPDTSSVWARLRNLFR